MFRFPKYPMRRRFRRRRLRIKRKRVFKRFTGAYSRRFFKLRRVVTVTHTANQPTFLQFNDNPSLSQDWVPVAELFQMYRVNGIKLTFVPAYTVNQQATAGSPINAPLYYVHDTNMTITAIPSENDMLQYENLKVKNILRMHSIYFKMARRINPTATTTLSTDGYSSVSNPQISQQIVALIPNISSNNLPIGRVVVTAYVSAKVRK